MSQNISSQSPFVRALVLSVLRNLQTKNLPKTEKYCVHCDMVPKFSEKVVQASMKEKQIPSPIPQQISARSPMPILPMQQPAQMQPPQQPQMQIPQKTLGEYGKLTPLFHDPSIALIECSGPNKPITISRMGQKQITKIILTPEEIKEFLNQISDKTRIPLLEGVFKAALDGFSIDAVISTLIGSRFIIRKQTPQMQQAPRR